MNGLTQAVKHLIIINGLLFLGPKLIDFVDLQELFALHYPENPKFGYWQFVTHMFMHSQQTFMHILFNMYGLWAFGTPLEQLWGKGKFLFFYFSAGIGAGLIYTLVNYYQFNSVYEQFINAGWSSSDIMYLLETRKYNTEILSVLSEAKIADFYSTFHTPAVGASGAIYGVLVAFGIAYPNAKLALIFLPVPIAAKYFVPALIAMDLFFGLTNYSLGNVAHFAHIGGAIIGFIIAYYWKKNQFNRWDR